MPEAINIILSDALFERLEKLIESAVKADEIKLSRIPERETAIARLRIEAKDALDDWFQKGVEKGLELAPSLRGCLKRCEV